MFKCSLEKIKSEKFRLTSFCFIFLFHRLFFWSLVIPSVEPRTVWLGGNSAVVRLPEPGLLQDVSMSGRLFEAPEGAREGCGVTLSLSCEAQNITRFLKKLWAAAGHQFSDPYWWNLLDRRPLLDGTVWTWLTFKISVILFICWIWTWSCFLLTGCLTPWTPKRRNSAMF